MSASRPWSIELTRTAIAALGEVEQPLRSQVAARLDDLASTGLPPGMKGHASGRGPIALPVGELRLLCMEDPEERRIYIVALSGSRISAGATLRKLAGHTMPRWITDWTGGDGMGWVLRDIRFALRSLRRSPGFTTTALLTLALGIGATAAIFSVANGVLLSPLPYGDADRVVTIWSSWNNFPDKTWVSEAEYRHYYQNNRSLEDLALYNRFSVNFTSVESPERVGASQITPNTLEVLGVQPVVGRSFTWAEASDSVSPILLGYAPWQRRFGGDPTVVGRNVEINGSMYPVVGVLPEGFALPVDYGLSGAAEVFFPRFVDRESVIPVPNGGGSHGDYVVARLRGGETAETALADLENTLEPLRADGTYAPERNFHPRLYPVKADIVGSARATIMVLLAAVGFVLLIACGNVANLLLSRSAVRKREVAVRTAMGASRSRILRQLMTESLVLAAGAGVLGLVFAYVGVDALLAIDPDAVPRSTSISLNGTVVLFTLAATVGTALLFGLVPAARVAHSGVGASLHDGSRAGQGGAGGQRLQGLLVASQMAMAVILLTGSGLMMKTFVSLLQVDTGISAENVLTMRVTAAAGRYPDAASVVGFYDQLLDQIEGIPGVQRASAARLLPLASTMGDAGFRPVDYQPGPNESTQADWQWAMPGYVEIMGIPLLEGRTLEDADRADGESVVLINQTLARKYWGDDSPIGAQVQAFGLTSTVVGVVGNIRHNGIRNEAKTRFYRPLSQATVATRSMTLVVASAIDPRSLVEPIRARVRAMDPSMPVSDVQTVDEVMSASVAQPRFGMMLLAAFASLALTLALVGIYGVIAYAVSQRTREIGIRMALGAETGQVIGMVVRQGMVMAMGGVALGTVIAWFMTGWMSGLLYGVTPQDPATFFSVPAVFATVALLACWIPATRASRVRPASALRYE
jgi:predicted permease